MSFIPVPNTCSIGMEMTLNGNPVSCVLNASHVGPFTVTNMENLGKAVIDGIQSALGATNIRGTSVLSLERIRLTDLSSSSGPAIDWTTGTVGDLPYAGIDGASVQGAQVATVVTWQTTARGRSFRGRNFWPGVPQDQLQNPDHIKATYVTLMEEFWLGIHTGINLAEAGNWTHVVVSRQHDGVHLTTGITTPVQTLRMNAKLGTIRRRVV